MKEGMQEEDFAYLYALEESFWWFVGMREITFRALTCSMEGAGFNTLRATYANTLLLPAAALRRLVLKRVGLVDSGSDVKPLPSKLEWLNRVLANALLYEARILRNPRATFPAGLSVICISQKPHA